MRDYCPTDQSARWAKCWPNKVHTLKTVRPYFQHVQRLAKTFEIRRDDRGFQPGDLLILAEWDGQFTGQDCAREVTYVLRDGEGFGVKPGYVVLGIREPKSATSSDVPPVGAP